MKVTPIGVGQFMVNCVDGGMEYVVDVTANEGRGACLCKDFQCRCQPKLNRGERVVLYGSIHRNTCKHIQAVIIYLGKQVAARMGGKKPEDVYDF